MDYNEIREMVLTEMTERAYRLMLEEDPKAKEYHDELLKMSKDAEAFTSGSGTENKLMQKYLYLERRMRDHEVRSAYVQGARDCILLLKGLNMM